MLLFDNETVHFEYSKRKLAACKNLLSGNSYKLLKEVIQVISNKAERSAFDCTQVPVNENSRLPNPFTVQYIGYLSRYSNNLLGFSEPQSILLPNSIEVFDRLYFKYVDLHQSSKADSHPLKLIESVMQRHINIDMFYGVNVEIDHDYIPGLVAPVKVDFSGRNEVDVYAQVIDMNQNSARIAVHVNAFAQLLQACNENDKTVQNFLIATEPDRKMAKQFDIWQQLRESRKFNYLDLKESERLIEYAQQHNVKPLTRKMMTGIDEADVAPF